MKALTKQKSSIIPILITAGILFLVGWLGLFFLMQNIQPYLGARWLWFFLFTLAITGTALPIVTFLNKRFPTNPPIPYSSLLRQSIWVAVYFDLLAWLQLGRILNPILILVLAIGFIIIENLIRMIEKSRWQPSEEIDE